MQTSPHEITEPLFFAQQNQGDFVLCRAKLWKKAYFAPRNREDIVSGAKKTIKLNFLLFFSNYFCKLMSFPRSLEPFVPLFKEKTFCVTVPLNQIESCANCKIGYVFILLGLSVYEAMF